MIDQKVLDLAIAICKRFEGFSSKVYLCPAGIPTQGYGTVFKPDKTRVTLQDPPISKELAESWLVSEIKTNYMYNALIVSPILAKYPNTLAAITSFCYNLGVPRYRASTLRRKIDREDFVSAKQEILKWARAGGKVLPGLLARRTLESKLLGT